MMQVMIIYLMLFILLVGKLNLLPGPMVLGSDNCGEGTEFIGQMDSVSVLGSLLRSVGESVRFHIPFSHKKDTRDLYGSYLIGAVQTSC